MNKLSNLLLKQSPALWKTVESSTLSLMASQGEKFATHTPPKCSILLYFIKDLCLEYIETPATQWWKRQTAQQENLGKDLNTHVTKENTQMANKLTKKLNITSHPRSAQEVSSDMSSHTREMAKMQEDWQHQVLERRWGIGNLTHLYAVQMA